MTIKFSENKVFAIDTNQEQNLFIKKDEVERVRNTNSIVLNKFSNLPHRIKELKEYDRFTNNLNLKKIPNDCLILAEGLVSGNLNQFDNKKALLRVDEPKHRLFGHTDGQNITIANDALKELNKGTNDELFHNISPNINDAYVMMPVELDVSGGCPYHAAAVIFKDNDTTITLESDAGNVKMRKPVFDMYSTVYPSKSFYSKFKDMYTVNNKIPAVGKLIHRDKIKPNKTKTLNKLKTPPRTRRTLRKTTK
jgi:hypothetical protein